MRQTLVWAAAPSLKGVNLKALQMEIVKTAALKDNRCLICIVEAQSPSLANHQDQSCRGRKVLKRYIPLLLRRSHPLKIYN
jgi:hypothetical protein